MFKKLNKRAEKLTLMDVKLLQLSTFFISIAMVKFIPDLLKINYSILLVLAIIFLAKPFYSFWLKK
ncbi:MAG: hypothetical protein K9L86_03355 [Candidatus Omnitrophica bacterium]|nr:hypothetical protein [Candidatus Omnitrophota bacterium]